MPVPRPLLPPFTHCRRGLAARRRHGRPAGRWRRRSTRWSSPGALLPGLQRPRTGPACWPAACSRAPFLQASRAGGVRREHWRHMGAPGGRAPQRRLHGSKRAGPPRPPRPPRPPAGTRKPCTPPSTAALTAHRRHASHHGQGDAKVLCTGVVAAAGGQQQAVGGGARRQRLVFRRRQLIIQAGSPGPCSSRCRRRLRRRRRVDHRAAAGKQHLRRRGLHALPKQLALQLRRRGAGCFLQARRHARRLARRHDGVGCRRGAWQRESVLRAAASQGYPAMRALPVQTEPWVPFCCGPCYHRWRSPARPSALASTAAYRRQTPPTGRQAGWQMDP